jgi:uncharacterized protein (UPF0333 family)
MKRKRINSKLVKAEKGSVMMEYLVLNLGFFVVLVLSAHFLFPDFSNKEIYTYDPVTGNFTQAGNTKDSNKGGSYGQYGLLGAAFVKHYNMMLDLVSMPYP